MEDFKYTAKPITNRVSEYKAGRQLRGVFVKIMNMHYKSIMKRFEQERGVDGKYWTKLKGKYPPGKKKLQGPDKGINKNGVEFDRTNIKMINSFFKKATKEGMLIRNMRKYATYHEYGVPSRNLPKRSFMGASAKQQKVYDKMVIDVVTKYLASNVVPNKKKKG